jgi:hypothetical protein
VLTTVPHAASEAVYNLEDEVRMWRCRVATALLHCCVLCIPTRSGSRALCERPLTLLLSVALAMQSMFCRYCCYCIVYFGVQEPEPAPKRAKVEVPDQALGRGRRRQAAIDLEKEKVWHNVPAWLLLWFSLFSW